MNSTLKGKIMKLSIKSFITAGAIALATLTTTAVYATEVDVIVNAAEGGNAWRNGELLRNALNKLGYRGNLVATGSTCNAITHMDSNTKTPMVLVHSDINLVEHGPKGCAIKPTAKNIVAPFYDRLQAVCVRKNQNITNLAEFIASRDRITIGTPASVPPLAFKQLSELTGKQLVRVPYASSNDLLRGHLAGDTDLMYTGLTQRETTSENIVCLTNSSNTTVNGIPSMSTVYPNWNYATLGAAHYIYGRNFTPELQKQMATDVSHIIKSDPDVSKFIAVSNMTPGTEMKFNLDFFYHRVNQWSGQ
jgi:tripartite-type tricarboxylate transporter receptor subunit TctC